MNPDSPEPPTRAPEFPLVKAPGRRISRRASIIGGAVAVLALAGIGWLAWSLTHPDKPAEGTVAGAPGGPGGGRPSRAQLTTVGVAAAERADIPVVLDALGTVVPQATVRVRPQVGGVLLDVLFKEGQVVRKGDLLATIDPRQYELALQQAIGQRQRDEAQLESAKVTLQRFSTLLRQDSIARQEVDTQASLVKQLEGAVVIDKANEGTARLNLGYTRIVAPVSGRVGLRTVDVGNVVSTSDANGVALITQISPIDVQFAVPQDQAPALQQNASGVKVNALDRTRLTLLDTGTFTSLDNQVDTQTGTVRAKARFNNRNETLFPSQFVNVQVMVRVIRDAVTVPVSAMRQGANGGEYVFVLTPDRTVTQRTVTRGQATVDRVQVTSGLNVGERVVTEGADRLRDGARVNLQGEAPRGRRGASAPEGPGSAAAAAAPAEGDATAATGERRRRRAEGESRAADDGGRAAAAAQRSAGDKVALPTPEQRQRMLDAVKDNPEQLERRKRFLEALDKGDPAALERWRERQARRESAGSR